MDQTFQGLLFEAEGREIEAAISRIEKSDNNLLTAHGRENRNPEFDAAQLRISGRVTFLRQVTLVADEIGHYLEPPGYLLHQIERQMHKFTENAVQSDPHNQGTLPRFDVYIARANLDRVEDQVIHQ